MAKLFMTLIWVWIGLVVTKGNCPHEDAGLKKWSEDSTWIGNEENPSKVNSTVRVNETILLDVQPENDIACLIIEAGAELVFSPAVDIELRVRHILVKGTLTIGSDTCLYTGKLTITLMGHINDTDDHPDFGKKFIGVPSGGVVNIHGQYKKSWTKLTETLPVLPQSAVIFRDKIDQEDRIQGLMVYNFDPDTGKPAENMTHYSIRRADQPRTDAEIQKLADYLKTVKQGNIVAAAVRKSILNKDNPMDLSKLYDLIELYAFGSVNNKSLLRKAKFYDGFSIAFMIGDPSHTVEKFDSYKAGGVKQTSTAKMIRREKKYKIEVTSFTSSRGHGKSFVEFLVTNTDHSLPILTVADDITTWNPNDVLAIASTDYDWQQMEYTTVIDCDGKCNNKQVMVDLTPKFTHFGKVFKNVDMRAAVAAVSRNVLIQGDMLDGDDNFGGHFKVDKGAAGIYIENAEFAHMGQNHILGRYPLHLHKMGTTSTITYFKNLCVHHTYSRCFTIHATHDVQVIDNSCIESHGHGYFLEDGAELNTVFDGNLGFGQRRGNLIPTDRFPSTFYLTNPQTKVLNNYAAGSHGNGFWWLFPKGEVAQPEGYPGEFVHTKVPISQYYNNIASGNARYGHTINGQVFPDGKFRSISNYKPTSEVIIDRNSGFKNNMANFHMRGDNLTLTRVSASDAPYNVLFEGVSRIPYLQNSVIIGDSENKGKASLDGQGNQIADRSLPKQMRNRPNWPRIGLAMPQTTLDVHNVWFSGFAKTQLYDTGAIGFRRAGRATSLQSKVTNAMFGFDDPTNGNRVFGFNNDSFFYSRKENSVLPDVDGSLTSVADSYIVRPTAFQMSDNCVKRNTWNLAICDETFVQVQPFFVSNDTNKVTMVRLDNEAQSTGPNKRIFNMMVGYTYGMNWMEEIPKAFSLRAMNIDEFNNVIIGACVPKGSTPHVRINMRTGVQKDSVDDLTCWHHYVYDEDVGIVLVKLMTDNERSADDDRQCPGGRCTNVSVRATGNTQSNKDCIENYLNKYPQTRKKRAAIAKSTRMRRALDVPEVLGTDSADPPRDWGAGPQF